MLLTAALVLIVMVSFDLSGIAMMGSAAFLLIYAAVNAGHLKVLRETGASAVLVWLSLLTCLAMFAVLCAYIYREQPRALDQPLPVLLEGAVEQCGPRDEVFPDTLAGCRDPDGVDQYKAAELDHQQQPDEEREDPGLQ